MRQRRPASQAGLGIGPAAQEVANRHFVKAYQPGTRELGDRGTDSFLTGWVIGPTTLR